MTTITETIREPSYYHREFKNDVLPLKEGAEHSKNTLMQQCIRGAIVALPYVSLYRPVGTLLSCTLGTFRTCTSIDQTINSLGKGDIKNASYGLLQTTISAAAVAGTIFAHPAGMLISTMHDLLMETCQLIHHLQNKNQKEAFNSCLNLFNNALYLSLFMYGRLELSILSLAGQILLGLYHAHKEYRSGHWLEAAGHIGMAAVRSNQLLSQVHALRISLAMQESKNQDRRKSIRSRTKTEEARLKSRRENRNKTARNKKARPAAPPHNTPSASASNDKPVSTPSQEKAADSAAPQTTAPIPKTLSERIKEYESNSEGWPALHYAIHMNDEEAAQHFINTKPEQANMSTPSIPIMSAQMGKNADKDCDHRKDTESGISAIELAIRHHCTTQFVERLLALGADFKGVRKEYYGNMRDDWESLTTWVHEKNKLVNWWGNADHQLFTPIYWAIVNKDKALFDLLISKGCSPNDLAYKNRQEQYTAQQLLEKIGS